MGCDLGNRGQLGAEYPRWVDAVQKCEWVLESCVGSCRPGAECGAVVEAEHCPCIPGDPNRKVPLVMEVKAPGS